ncbi:hypothetical protein M0804_004881 [Polistes exclamans]|nr:hypothetical protein M0804_004881 [Polistes exclamans]
MYIVDNTKATSNNCSSCCSGSSGAGGAGSGGSISTDEMLTEDDAMWLNETRGENSMVGMSNAETKYERGNKPRGESRKDKKNEEKEVRISSQFPAKESLPYPVYVRKLGSKFWNPGKSLVTLEVTLTLRQVTRNIPGILPMDKTTLERKQFLSNTG